ncbi:related to integral membrane protein [Phialocephala subalpina]|uniref:Related to integral membrane protein n=1 Tax=Phialocephala subalpina TaxID=576137 RepID=A0A1L7WL92_9HELO|nr:related to integral membrane protein [Phialocephala subalpina]
MSNSPSSQETPSMGREKAFPVLLSRRGFARFATIGGPLSLALIFIMLPSGAFLPPISPNHSPGQVVDHYRRHETGLKGGIALIQFIGLFFMLYTAAVGGQISQIPGVSKTVVYSQLLGGCVGGIFLTIPSYFFATTLYRLDRTPELTELLNDMSWIFFAMPFSGLLCQDLAFSYAVLLDRRPRPLFPRWLAWVSTGLTLSFYPAIGVNCVHSGVVAWNGVLTFWTAGVCIGAQICLTSLYTWKAISRTDLPGDEEVVSGEEREMWMSRVEVEELVERLVQGAGVASHPERDSK